MKHAGKDALDALEPLLAELRTLPALTERARGTFYRKGRAFLHFHEDAAGLFADARLETEKDFARLRVSSAGERRALLAAIRKALKVP